MPSYLFHPGAITANYQLFKAGFPGRIVYAVKANDEPVLLRFLVQSGVNAFDVASLYEVQLMSKLAPGAELFFMNPVKCPHAIAEAYNQFGVRNFVLDSEAELHKIVEATNNAQDLHLFVRIAVCNQSSVINLGLKFGIAADEALALLEKVNSHAQKTSICFHVGSQCKEPESYVNALDATQELIEKLSFKVTAIDIGGGFPANYKQHAVHPLKAFLEHLQVPLRRFASDVLLLAEPGRALVAEGYSLLTKVLGRKDNQLYLNDGRYGGLFEIHADIVFPAVAYSGDQSKVLDSHMDQFKLWGPSCDSYDDVEGSFLLPANINEGDYIEFSCAGAYSKVFRSNFNGFCAYDQALINRVPD